MIALFGSTRREILDERLQRLRQYSLAIFIEIVVLDIVRIDVYNEDFAQFFKVI
jgi:hypothetical protein